MLPASHRDTTRHVFLFLCLLNKQKYERSFSWEGSAAILCFWRFCNHSEICVCVCVHALVQTKVMPLVLPFGAGRDQRCTQLNWQSALHWPMTGPKERYFWRRMEAFPSELDHSKPLFHFSDVTFYPHLCLNAWPWIGRRWKHVRSPMKPDEGGLGWMFSWVFPWITSQSRHT